MSVNVVGSGTRRRYSMNVVRFARRVYESNGSIEQTRSALLLQGYSPSFKTVARWVDEGYLQRDRERRRRPGRPGPGPRRRAWHDRLARAHELRSIGVSYRSVAAIMNHDFPDLQLTDEQVRYALQGRTRPESIRDLMEGRTLRKGPR